MSRYRKIEVRTWTDRKFRELSPMPASGQGLWLFLMCGPHTSPIPGLFRAGRAALAEELGWELEAFEDAFSEVSGKGMAKADFKNRLVWLPKALKHNKPESPNVVKSWRVELDLLPECELKAEALASISQQMRELGDGYFAAFCEISAAETGTAAKASVKASVKALAKGSSEAMANQEQEQEQEQEHSSLRSEASTAAPVTDDGDSGESTGRSPDRARTTPEQRAARIAVIATEAMETFNASPLTKAHGGLVPNVNPKVGAKERRKNVGRCVQIARDICNAVYGSTIITREFWIDYWAICLADDHKSGRRGGGKDHPNWVPTFEYLTRPDTMQAVYDAVASAQQGAAQ